jgi:uncharacterized protein (TIGR00369 family)
MENRLSIETLRALGRNTASAALGIELVAIAEDRIELRMPITDAARQPMGLLHGGVSMVLAETAASMHALWLVDPAEKVPVGIEINGSHLRSASDGFVKAVGTVLRRSRALIFHRVEIYHEGTGELLSTARVTNYYKPIGGKQTEPGSVV